MGEVEWMEVFDLKMIQILKEVSVHDIKAAPQPLVKETIVLVEQIFIGWFLKLCVSLSGLRQKYQGTVATWIFSLDGTSH